jgi:hypothetical protein
LHSNGKGLRHDRKRKTKIEKGKPDKKERRGTAQQKKRERTIEKYT